MGKTSTQHSLAYNPALDGLRGLAIALVFITHLNMGFKGGTFGVDIFFVLSGYLITEVLNNARESKNFLWVFYFKRFLRLFPALAAVCMTVVVIGGVSGGHSNIYHDALSSLLYSQSWTSGFSDGFSFYLGQTWSLSVEEHFYLVFPFVWVLATRTIAKTTFFIFLLLLTLAVAYAMYMAKAQLSYARIYYSADTRFQAILIGAFGAVASRTPFVRPFLERFIATLPLLPMVAIAWICNSLTWSIQNSLMVSVASLILILRLTLKSRTLEATLLSIPPLVNLGKISYGFYLWHVPILLLLQYHFKLSLGYIVLIGLPASLLVSIASYRLIEQPALRLRTLVSPEKQAKFGRYAVPASVLSISLGLVYFQFSDIDNFVRGTKLAVTAYGPTVYRIGDKGPLQPDGSLVMWMALNSRADMLSNATISDLKSLTFVGKSGITIVVPQSILTTPGKHTIKVFTSTGKLQLPPMDLDIVAAPL